MSQNPGSSSESPTANASKPPHSVAPPSGRYWKRGLVLLILVIVGVVVWEEVLEDRLIAKRFGTIIPGEVYRSGQISPYLIEDVLRDNEIDVVIDFTGIGNGPDEEQQAETAAIASLGITGHRFPLAGDGTGNPESYVSALVTLREAMASDQQVLMHCSAGSQRTGGATGFYRLFYEGWTPEQVIDELKQYDWSPRKDTILLRYMNEHMAFIAQRLVEEGALAAVPDPLPVMPVGPHE
ncbi:MAG: tyrosine-protein phosphatase [Phycisphaeraceae bacterium]